MKKIFLILGLLIIFSPIIFSQEVSTQSTGSTSGGSGGTSIIGTFNNTDTAQYFSFASLSTVYTVDTVKVNVHFHPNITTKINGGAALARLVGDGTHTPVFNSFNTTGSFVNTSGKVNLCTVIYDGVEYWLIIQQKP